MKREENRIRRLQMAAQCVNKQISISEMAIEQNISYSTVKYWLDRLNDVPTSKENKPSACKTDYLDAFDFKELTLPDTPEDTEPPVVQMELTLPNGVNIKIYK